MAQIHVDKDRSYRLWGGKALDATNERLAACFHKDECAASMIQIHPTKGFRALSRSRLERGKNLEATMHRWARIAAKISGSQVGGVPQEQSLRRPALPHQSQRECLRRIRQRRA